MRKSQFAIGLFLFAIAFSACANRQSSNSSGNPAAPSAEPTPDKAAIEAQLKAMEYDWPRILKERDGAAVRKLEADDIMILLPDGSDGSKEGDIKDIEAGEMSNDSQEISDITVNVLDNNSAVVRSRTIVKGDNHVLSDGKCQTIVHEFRTIDTFVRRNGQWQIVASATVPVRSAPAVPQSATPAAATPSETAAPKTSPVAKVSPARAASPTKKPTPP